MKQFIQLSVTEFKRIFSNNVVMLIFFCAPLLYGILFGYTYKKAKIEKLPVAVVDMDHSFMSDKIIDALNDNENLKILKVYTDETNLQHEVIYYNYQAVITIPEGFYANLNQKRYPEINVDINMANILTANFASRGIQTVLATLNAGIEIEALKKQGIPPSQAATMYEPFKTNYNRLFNPGNNYMSFMWPGLMGALIQQVFFLALALVFARDFEDNYFSVLVQKTRWSPYLIVLKVLPFYLLGSLVWLIAICLFKWFNIGFDILNTPMLFMSFLLTTAAIFVGVLFSIAFPNQLKATEVLMVIATPGFILSGFTWPLSGMPWIIQKVAGIIPLTHYLEAFRKIAVYGGSWRDIQPQINALLWIIIIAGTLSALLLQIRILKERKKLSAIGHK